jgi:uncharacterized Fe-S cluster-containing radical SAM superfamily protein
MTGSTVKLIKTEKFSSLLRSRAIDVVHKKVLVTNFAESQQKDDLTLPPNCSGFGRIHHFYRHQGSDWPTNPLPIEPALHYLKSEPKDQLQVQVFQNAACSWRCWYCFVDDKLLSADRSYSAFKSADELLDLYETENIRPTVIDLSGGQPDLVPEWTLWFADSLRRRGLDKVIYLWSDDNLSNDYLWKFLDPNELQRLISYRNYGRVGCFKGYDPESFSFNTQAEPSLFHKQFSTMKRLVDSGMDVYGYVTLTSENDSSLAAKIHTFVDRLQNEVHPSFPLRTIPLRIMEFTPTSTRMTDSRRRAMQTQMEAAQIWQDELAKRFDEKTRRKSIFEHRLLT